MQKVSVLYVVFLFFIHTTHKKRTQN